MRLWEDYMKLQIYDLTCEYQKEALGVNTFHPVFSWKFFGGGSGACQNAYRIIVNDTDGGLLADTGKVISDEQSGIEVNLEGKLMPFTRYAFYLNVWMSDTHMGQNELKTGKQNMAIASSYFVTGVFKAHQWKGMWFDKTWGPHSGKILIIQRVL